MWPLKTGAKVLLNYFNFYEFPNLYTIFAYFLLALMQIKLSSPDYIMYDV